MLVTTDSGARFFGVAFDVPVVSLFGPTDVGWTRTHYVREICLQHAVPCGPCGRRTCPLDHHDCMRSLSVDRVYAAVKEQLAATSAAQAA
jgi:heptosyltransferase-2